MEELTDDAKKMLEALKTDETPSKSTSDRMWAAVAAGGATAAIATGLGKTKLILFAALGVTTIGAIVYLAQPDQEPGGTAGIGSAAPSTAASANTEPEPDPRPEPEPPPEEPTVEPESEQQPEPDQPTPTPAGETKKNTAPVPTAADLERDLELIGEAKVALRQKDAQEALRILNEHEKDFPRSSFAEERAFLEMTALCDLGKKDRARKQAERFLKKHPKSALTPRVKTLCTDE